MAFNKNIYHLLPNIELLNELYDKCESEFSVITYCYNVINSVVTDETNCPKRALFLVTALKDRLYEELNTGHWMNVPEKFRIAFSWCSFLMAYFQLENNVDEEAVQKCIHDLDYGLLMGRPILSRDKINILTESIRIIEEHFSEKPTIKRIKLDEEASRSANELIDIGLLQRPSLELFEREHFKKRIPLLLSGIIDHWPALDRWRQPNYLLSVAGDRTVPIEIGQHYTNDDWSQDLVKLREFLSRQIDTTEQCDRIEYLAQHNLFDQIPALRTDISVPDYCCLSEANSCDISPDIKAWLGPKGTISPMHYDAKHNLLCQVFGYKKIILASPADTSNLYAHDGDMLNNTSQIDAENLDLETFSLAANVKFYHLNLYKGEVLYIPPGWWHYIRNIMVILESAVSGHQINTIRERLADKIEMIRFDPYIQRMSLYRERRRIRSM